MKKKEKLKLIKKEKFVNISQLKPYPGIVYEIKIKEQGLKNLYKRNVEPLVKKNFPKIKKSQYPILTIGNAKIGYFDGKKLEARGLE